MKKVFIAIAAAVMLTGCGRSGKTGAPVAQKETKNSSAVTSAVSEASEKGYETFYGVLMDECCSDIEDPELHETNCMFMKECRESGYGLEIQQEDGSWKFYMFDEPGQQLTWDYLNETQRENGLYVTVTGIMENEKIKVKTIEES